jgi:UrcA family protein
MSSTISKRGAVAGLAVLFGGLLTGGAMAADSKSGIVTERSVTVDYSDLDLSQPEGVNILYSRVSNAAETACGEPQPRELARYAKFRQCVDRAIQEAVGTVNAPALTAVHRARRARNVAG